ncbi:MAG: PEP-CTERM sorting domain-containing protein [Kiritimatiellaeota bacterium]|nr:PEP-CTERM sorting domain-containing protein [Kiritimatiellota bacterium]
MYSATGWIGVNGNNNTVTVTDTNSVWSNTGDLLVGLNGSGNTLTIADGGAVNNGWDTYGAVIGLNAGASNNAVLVTGPGSVWNNSTNLNVGQDGSGNALTVADGGTVYSATVIIGEGIGANSNAATVTGSASVWNSSGGLYVGNNGAGNTLTIADGGTVYSVGGNIGFRDGANNNAVTVTDPISFWNNGGTDLTVGSDGSGNSLTITNGGTVYSASGWIGFGVTASNNTVTVTDPNSSWNNSGDLRIGDSGTSNTLTIANGGNVYNSTSYIGMWSGANNNAVLVTDPVSIWNNGWEVNVGLCGSSNTLTIANGGTVYSAGGFIGRSSGADNNAVTVTGAGSVWSTWMDFYVGFSGSSNTLTIADSGAVTVGGNLLVGSMASATNNRVLVAGGNLNVAGTLDIRNGALEVDSGSVVANSLLATNGANSAVHFNGGVAEFRAMTISGSDAPTTIGNGASAMTLSLNGPGAFQGGLNLASNATLSGSGLINDAVTVSAGGILSPGNSPGTLTFSNLTLETGAIITNEIASLALSDQIVAANLTVNGVVTWNLTLTGSALAPNNALKLMDVDSYLGSITTDWLSLGGTNLLCEGDSFALQSADGSNNLFSISYAGDGTVGGHGNDVVLTVIPEPASVLVILLGSGLLVLRRRWKKRCRY